MLQSMAGTVTSYIKEEAFSSQVTKVWIYRDRTVVVDLVHRGVNFSFDLTPAGSGLVDLDLLQRKPWRGLYLTPTSERKARVASATPLRDALALIKEFTGQMLLRIDHVRAGNDDAVGRLDGPRHAVGPSPGRPLRVGVLTLPLNKNFGGNLQAFAMVQALRKRGHSTVLLNRQHPPTDASAPTDPATDQPLADSYGMNSSTPNASFIDRYLTPTTPRLYSSQQMASHVRGLDLDAIVVGSDQVWRAKYARSILTDFFLGFLPASASTLRISYAASFGADKIAYGEKQAEVARLLARFDAISVREDSAVSLCRSQLGGDAEHVLDPTMLLDPADYAAVLPPGGAASDGQLLTYVLDADDDKARVIHEIERRLGISAFGTNGLAFGAESALRTAQGDRSVEHWLASFYRPAFVITDSFHGVVFSILFNRPFIAYGNPKRGMARFESLLRMFGLESRLVVSSDDLDVDAMLAPVDWARVNARLAELRSHSVQFLDAALAKARPSPGGLQRGPAARSTRTQRLDPLSGNPLRVLCTGCGVCVSESRGTLEMAWNPDGFLMPKAVAPGVPLEARKVCPFNPDPEEHVKDEDALAEMFLSSASHQDPSAGRFEGAYVGYSQRYRETSSSGGIATYVFEKLIERGVVDYLFIVQSDGTSGYRYAVCRDIVDYRNISKTRYYPVSMHELFHIIDRTQGRVAVSGVACFVKAIRLKQHYHPHYRDKIPFVVGIICGGLKSRHYTEFLAKSAGIIGPYTFPEYRLKDAASTASDYSFGATDADAKVRQIKMQRVGNNWGAGLFKARACDFCSDVLTELADVSLGDAWLPQYRADGMGHNVVLTRTPLAESIIRDGIASGELHADEVPVGVIVDSQAGGFNHKRKGLKFRVWLATHFHRFAPPSLRQRLLTDVSISDAIVQIHRERTRSKSLAYWTPGMSVGAYRKRMRASRLALKAATAARKDGSNTGLIASLNGPSPAAGSRDDARHPFSRLLRLKTRRDGMLAGLLQAALFGRGPVARSRDQKR